MGSEELRLDPALNFEHTGMAILSLFVVTTQACRTFLTLLYHLSAHTNVRRRNLC